VRRKRRGGGGGRGRRMKEKKVTEFLLPKMAPGMTEW
jgi:hypothetical protein